MVEFTKRELDAIHATHDMVIRIDTILGDGNKGLCHDVHCHNRRINRLELLIAFLVGCGILGGGAVGLLKYLGG